MNATSPAIQQIDEELDRLEARAAELRGLISCPPPVSYRDPTGVEVEVPVIAGDRARAADNPIVRRLQRAAPAPIARQVGGSRPAKVVVRYPRWVAASGIIILVLAFMPALAPAKTNNPATALPQPSPSVPPPPAYTPTPPATPTSSVAATPTPPHGGLSAPNTLSGLQVGAKVQLSNVPIIPAPTLGDGSLIIPPPPEGELSHYGSYPGEAGNLVLLGNWLGFGDQLENLQLNDKLTVTNREGRIFVYQVIPCQGVDKACKTAKDEVWPLGFTPQPTLTLIAARSDTTNYVVEASFIGIKSHQ